MVSGSDYNRQNAQHFQDTPPPPPPPPQDTRPVPQPPSGPPPPGPAFHEPKIPIDPAVTELIPRFQAEAKRSGNRCNFSQLQLLETKKSMTELHEAQSKAAMLQLEKEHRSQLENKDKECNDKVDKVTKAHAVALDNFNTVANWMKFTEDEKTRAAQQWSAHLESEKTPVGAGARGGHDQGACHAEECAGSSAQEGGG